MSAIVWRACVRACRWPRPGVCGRPIFTHSIQLVNTKPRSVCGMPRMAKRIRTTYRSGARIAWRTKPVVGSVAGGVRVQRSPQLIVLYTPTARWRHRLCACQLDRPVQTASAPVFRLPTTGNTDAFPPPPLLSLSRHKRCRETP